MEATFDFPVAPVQADGSCVTLENNGPAADKLDIVFLPDGYTDMGRFVDHVKLSINTLKTVEPFKSNAKKMNFYYVAAKKVKMINKFNSEDAGVVAQYASKCPAYDQKVILSVNSGAGSWARLSKGLAVVTTTVPGFTMDVVHELGHSFGGLLDEVFSGSPIVYGDVSIKNTLSAGPNCDVSGCPRWCTGGVSPKYRNYESICAAASSKASCDGTRGDTFGCVWATDEFGKNARCVVHSERGDLGTDAEEDFGVSCQAGLGCFQGCSNTAANLWSPTRVSLMGQHNGEDPDELKFNKIGLDQINRLLAKYK